MIVGDNRGRAVAAHSIAEDLAHTDLRAVH
jgi:hypothetical protein